MYPVGIDLGTSNSVISVYRKGKTEVLSVDGYNLVPSVVAFRDANTMLVGGQAKRMAEMYPETTVVEVKRLMGDRKHRYNIHGKSFSPVDISSFIVKKLIEGGEKTLGCKIEEVVITVPAYFTEDQKEDTKSAGRAAGVKVLRLLPEPTAAAIAYGFGKGRDQTLLVYDLGGGTFDVSLLKVEGDNFEVVAVNGNHDLGGRNFDAAIMSFALDAFKKDTGIDLQKLKDKGGSDEALKALQVLKEASEKAKIELTESQETGIDCPNLFEGKHLSVDLTRNQFERMIEGHILKTRDLVRKTLGEARMDVDDIDRVILVGGSTKIPLVKQVISESVKDPFIAENVDEIVSTGASLVAASLGAPSEEVVGLPEEAEAQDRLRDLKFQNVTAHSLGAKVQDEKQNPFFQPMIVKNTKVPCEGFFIGSTAGGGQSMVRVEAFRGEDRDCSKNQRLGDCLLTGIKISKDPVPVAIWFKLDEDGILHVRGATINFTNPYRVMEYIKKNKLNELQEGSDFRVEKEVSTTIDAS